MYFILYKVATLPKAKYSLTNILESFMVSEPFQESKTSSGYGFYPEIEMYCHCVNEKVSN
jgi:hypothetical protein